MNNIKNNISKNLNTIDNCINDLEKEIKNYKNKKEEIIKKMKDNNIIEDNEIIKKIKEDKIINEDSKNEEFEKVLNKCVKIKYDK